MEIARTGKIFGIGLNKTGTRSLAAALRILGFRTLHKGDTATSDLVDRAMDGGLPPLDLIGDQYDAYLDVDAIVRRFGELDSHYPDSKFILTTSEIDSWLNSRRRHAEANRLRAAEGRYDGPLLEIDLDEWRDEWKRHHDAVRAYFASRSDDLLVFDVRAGDDWTTLAPFLESPVPSRPFPWENREGMGTYNREAAWRRVRRRVDYVVGRARRRGLLRW